MVIGTSREEGRMQRVAEEKKGLIDTVLFDFDGTIMDTNNVIIQSWQHTFRTLKGIEKPINEIIATFGEPLETTMKRFFPGVKPQVAIDIYRSFHHECFEDMITLFDGIKELLQYLQKEKYKVGLVTSRLRGTTYRGLNKYDLTQYFQTIVTKEDSNKHKPDPEPILVALSKLESKPKRAIMLGDTSYDMICAYNAGVKSVLVGWALALTETDANGKASPDYVIKKPEQLRELL